MSRVDASLPSTGHLNFCLTSFFIRYQQILHRNIVYLATIADASPDDMPPSSNVKINHTIREFKLYKW